MKRKIGLIVLLLGLYSILFSGWKLITISYADKCAYVEGYKQEFLAENPNQVFDSAACMLKTESNLLKATHKYYGVTIVGSILFVLGIGLLFKNLVIRIKKKLFLTDVIEFLTGVIYILLMGYIFFWLLFPLYNYTVTECLRSNIFIFCIASIIGFFSSYYCLTNRYFANKKYFKWFLGAIITVISGTLLAYFIPFYINDIARTKINSFLKIEFFVPFVMLIFLVFGNIITGMIFKGFFNWTRLLYKK